MGGLVEVKKVIKEGWKGFDMKQYVLLVLLSAIPQIFWVGVSSKSQVGLVFSVGFWLLMPIVFAISLVSSGVSYRIFCGRFVRSLLFCVPLSLAIHTIVRIAI